MKKYLLAFLIGAVVVGSLVMSQQKSQVKTEASQPSSKTVVVNSVKEFNVTAKNWAFDPAEIKVKMGDKVKLNITSVDVNHGFALTDFDINQKLVPGQKAVVQFTADKKGEFSFRCNVMCGEGHRGMTGKLIVE